MVEAVGEHQTTPSYYLGNEKEEDHLLHPHAAASVLCLCQTFNQHLTHKAAAACSAGLVRKGFLVRDYCSFSFPKLLKLMQNHYYSLRHAKNKGGENHHPFWLLLLLSSTTAVEGRSSSDQKDL